MAKNIGESVNARLRNIARERSEDMQTVQRRYALERLLYRLTRTSFGERIALKGALIFVLHYGDAHRPTADLDINGYDEEGDIETLEAMVREAIALDVADGVDFRADTLEVRKERDGTIPGGKIALTARIHTSEVPVRVDAGFGCVITPDAVTAEYPSMLRDMPRPVVRVYPFETMIAEKLHAMARHGAESSRIRDYYDLWALSERREFDAGTLARAIRNTFGCYGMEAPPPGLDGLSERFVWMWSKQWDVVRKGKGLRFNPPALPEVVERLKAFIEPVLEHANDGPDPGTWRPMDGWSTAPGPAPR